ncbi:MAG: AI-2E family transporter [Lachnospiraceae bacterium]|nr:AI-2E family transporter [Lachnospiraceae bacterium]
MKKLFQKMKNRKYSQISWYIVWTIVIAYIILEILGHLGLIGGAISSSLSWMNILFKPLILGFALAYLLYPLDNFFEKQFQKIPFFKKKGTRSRPAAVALTGILILLGITLVLFLIVSAVTRDLSTAKDSNFATFITGISDSVNSLYKNLTSFLNNLNVSSDALEQYLKPLKNTILHYAGNLTQSASSFLTSLPSTLSSLLFAIIFAIYFQLDGEGLKRYWGSAFKAMLPKKSWGHIHSFLQNADHVFSGYIRGQLVDAIFMASVVSIALSLIGLPYSLLIGILTGLGNLIPYVGPFVAYTSIILVSLLNWNAEKLIVSLIVIFIIQTIDGNIINPKFLSNAIEIHPLLVIASLIIGGKIGGFLGMILAVPCGALVKLYFEKFIHYLHEKRNIDEDSLLSPDVSKDKVKSSDS